MPRGWLLFPVFHKMVRGRPRRGPGIGAET